MKRVRNVKDAARQVRTILAVSGGPDSVYLLMNLSKNKILKSGALIAHLNHSSRGRESERDEEYVRRLAKQLGITAEFRRWPSGDDEFDVRRAGVNRIKRVGFEGITRGARYGFLKELRRCYGGGGILVAHTADDQVETVLMRFLEGAGIAGLKGIPRETDDGIVRPILHVWKENIVKYLKKNKIPYRVDKSNFDTRFERNWIRHVLIPLLVKRYGQQVKKRIFALGERFRELDDYLDSQARRWIARNVKEKRTSPALSRKRYAVLPAALRVKVLQRICFDCLGLAPNERLLGAMDRSVTIGGPSSTVKAGKGWELVNRYEQAQFVPVEGTGRKPKKAGASGGGQSALEMKERRSVTPAQAKRIAAAGDAQLFDAAKLRLPLSVRPLRPGDRIRPFGMTGDKKLKEILIDRKVPRHERWGRAVVCDADGEIVWVPGVVRSALAPVTRSTRCAKIIRYLPSTRGDVAP